MTSQTACLQTASPMQVTLNPRNRRDILQNSLYVSTSCAKGWYLDLNPTKKERLPIDNSPHLFIYPLPSLHPPNTHTIAPPKIQELS